MRRLWNWLEWAAMCITNWLDDMDEHGAEFKEAKLTPLVGTPLVRQYAQQRAEEDRSGETL